MCGILLHLRDWRSNIWIQFNLNLNILLIERCRESSWEMTNPLWMSAMKADSLIDFLSPLTLPSSSTSSPHYLLVSEKTELWFNVRSHATDRCGETFCRQVGLNSMQRWYLCPFKMKITGPSCPLPFFVFLSFLTSPLSANIVMMISSLLRLQTLKVLHQIYCNIKRAMGVGFFLFCLFLFFYFSVGQFWVRQSLKFDEMYSTSVSLKSGVYFSVYVCVRVNLCISIKVGHWNQCPARIK